MTENKRFTYEYDEYNGNLFDNKMNTFYHIEDSEENLEAFCDRLNWLVYENKQLKERNNRQYDRLTHLWTCIENKDWETLTKEWEEIEEADKKLQEEWKCYK